MIGFVVILLLLVGLAVFAYLLGLRLGGDRYRDEVWQVRAESADAQRRLRELSRAVFVAMTEEAEHRRVPPDGPP